MSVGQRGRLVPPEHRIAPAEALTITVVVDETLEVRGYLLTLPAIMIDGLVARVVVLAPRVALLVVDIGNRENTAIVLSFRVTRVVATSPPPTTTAHNIFAHKNTEKPSPTASE